jgi:hypothetical protein
MKEPQDLLQASTSALSVSGALVPTNARVFVPRLPSTWPPVTMPPDLAFVDTLQRLFQDGMLVELENVCGDIAANHPKGLQGRGHVVAVAMMSMLDSLSQFAYPTDRQHIRIPNYVENYFPAEFHAIRQELNDGYRNGLIHEWFMRGVAFLPDGEPISIQANGSPILGLLTFKAGLTESVHRFLADLRNNQQRRAEAASRYLFLQTHTQS